MLIKELSTAGGDNQFYPTPPSVAGKMIAGLDLRYIHTVLEPSAGKGNLVSALARAFHDQMRYNRSDLDVDCCEIDPQLRQILKYEFSEEKKKAIWDRLEPYEHMGYSARTTEQNEETKRLKREVDIIENTHVHIVHDDFLTYRSYSNII